jgi:hypothetical protein
LGLPSVNITNYVFLAFGTRIPLSTKSGTSTANHGPNPSEKA